MKGWSTFIVMLICTPVLYTQPEWSWDLTRAFWNKRSQTIDLHLQVNGFTQDELFAHYPGLELVDLNDSTRQFKLHSIHRGKHLESSLFTDLPERVLILLDKGISAAHLPSLEAIARTIFDDSKVKGVVDVAYFAQTLSEVITLTEEKYADLMSKARSQVSDDQSTFFASQFLKLRPILKRYEKVYLLTNGCHPNSNAFKLLNQSSLLDQHVFAKTQVIPIGIKDVLEEDFFQLMESLNAFRINRNYYYEIPRIESSSNPMTHDGATISLRFKSISPNFWASSSRPLQLVYVHEGTAQQKDFEMVFNHLFDPILNNQFFTEDEPIFTVLLIGVLLGLLFFYLIPMYNRYHFKKNHVRVYNEIKQDELVEDPLKRSQIQDLDKVVVYADQVMLLDSWKFIHKSKESIDSVKDYSTFFQPTVRGDIFTQDHSIFKYLLPGFLGVLLATLVSVVYYLISRDLGLPFSEIDKTISIPPLANALLLKPFIVTFLWLTGIYSMYQYLTYRDWPRLTSLLYAIGGSFVGALLLTGLYIFMESYLPIPVGIILAHGFFGLLISFITVHRFTLNKYPKLFRDAGIIGLLSLSSFYLIPVILFKTNVELTISFFIGSLIFCAGIAVWLGNTIINVPKRKLKLIHTNGEEELFNLAMMIESKEKLIIGKGENARIRIDSENGQIKDHHAIVYKHLYKYRIKPESGSVYVNEIAIYKSYHLKEGDRITFDKDQEIQLIVLTEKE